MKKFISLFLIVIVILGVFINITTVRAIDTTQLFNITTDGFSCDGKIKYTVYLKQGVSFSGTSIRIKYDPDILEIQDCEPFMTEDSYGDPIENIPGIYETGNIIGTTNVYGCIFMYSGNNDYVAKTSDKAFITISLKLKDNIFVPFSETTVEFICNEFVSFDNPKLNIYNGNEKSILTLKRIPKEHYFVNNVCTSCGCKCFEYLKNDTGITVTKYNGRKAKVEIPYSINGFVVTGIGNGASPISPDFIDISIPDTVTSIKAKAFYGTQFYNNQSNWQNGALYKDNFLIDTNECLPLKYYVGSSTIVAEKAFDGFKGYILCEKNSNAHKYALLNGTDFILPTIKSADSNTTVDFKNQLIFTSVLKTDNAEKIVETPAEANLTVNPIYNMYLGTGSVFTVYDDKDYMGDYTLITEGDINGDGVCDIADAAVTYLYSADLLTPSQTEIYAANGEIAEEIDASDYQNVVNLVLNS